MNREDLNVAFYRVRILEKAKKREAAQVKWQEALRAVATRTLGELTNEDTIYDVHPEREVPIVGVHRVLNTDFMTSIDYTTKKITDLMDDAAAGDYAKQFAHTTAMAFFPDGNVVAIASTTTNSPRAPKVLTDFLTHALPQEAGVHWLTEPLLEPNKVAELKRAKGVEKFEARISSASDLFQNDTAGGVASYADSLADQLGGEVVIDITVRLAPQSRSSLTESKFLQAVLPALGRVDPRKKAVAKAIFPDGSSEELNLVASKLAATMPINLGPSERMRYSALLDGLESVGVAMKDRVSELLRG